MRPIVTLTMNPAVDKSARVDSVVPDRKLRCDSVRLEPGGGGINVSRAIHRLGGRSLALYPTGGHTGKLLQELLDNEEVEHRPIPIQGRTRKNLMVYASSTDQQFRFGMPGPSLSEQEWSRCLNELTNIEPTPDYIVASGSLPSGVPESFYGDVAEVAKEFEAKLIVDTSGEPLLPALYKGVFLIKPNLRELKALAGEEIEHESQHEEKAKQIVDNGQSEVVVVSRGAGGALVLWSDGHEHIRAPTVPIKSKVGAGDSMVAGMVLSLARGQDLLEAVRFGIATGSAAVMTPGSDLCRREDAEKLYKSMVSRKRE